MKNFWVKFAIQEGLDVLEAYITTTKIPDTVKQDAAQLIADGKKLILEL